jgi:hypothetical protein
MIDKELIDKKWYQAVLKSDWALVNFLEIFRTPCQHPGYVAPPEDSRDSWACKGEFTC